MRVFQNAVEAQKSWREVPVQQRVRVLIKFHALLNEQKDDIAKAIVRCVFPRTDIVIPWQTQKRAIVLCVFSSFFWSIDSVFV
jgi:hypothetical protein